MFYSNPAFAFGLMKKSMYLMKEMIWDFILTPAFKLGYSDK